jgi:hypothetical protein
VALRRRRHLPAPGEVLVAVDDPVEPGTVVARTRPAGALVPVNVAHELDIGPAEVPGALAVAPGDTVARGAVLARTRELWGLLRSSCRAPVGGVVRDVSPRTGQVLIEAATASVEVRALLAGRVVAVAAGRGVDVAGRAALVQGVLGVGGEACGPLAAAVRRPESVVTAEMIGPELAGRVVLGGALVTGSALQRAAAVGVAALVTGGIEDRDLTDLLGAELAVAVTGSEELRPVLVITGGFGRFPFDPLAFDLLLAREGALACACGRTRVRAGAVRPEVIVPLETGGAPGSGPGSGAGAPGAAGPAAAGVDARGGEDGRLAIGRRVRVVTAPHLGRIGTVAALPTERRTFPSEGRFLAVEVALPGGRRIVVPRANVELLSPDAPTTDGVNPRRGVTAPGATDTAGEVG